MLEKQTIETIKATVPVLEEHGKAITSRFYSVMFERHPELLHIFNHANQKQGRQQEALANVVYQAAKHIDQLETLLPAVEQIGHKHRSLGVKKEHYPIVGEHLLFAIKDVLGDAATPDILDAWEKAYNVIADVFIQVEEKMYQQAVDQDGGWEGFRPFVVDRKVVESDVITSFYLKPQDGEKLASFLPGQYVSVKVQIPGETYTHIRQYSLSDAPGNDYYRLSIKHERGNDCPDGIVSTYMHQHIEEGETLFLSAPAGDFVLDTHSDRPLALISGGVGLTPLMSMLHAWNAHYPERNGVFIHAAINGDTHALREEVEEIVRYNDRIRSYVCYERPTAYDREKGNFDREGYVNRDFLERVIGSPNVQCYVCGPPSFMKSVVQALEEWGVPSANIHYEFFGPSMQLQHA